MRREIIGAAIRYAISLLLTAALMLLTGDHWILGVLGLLVLLPPVSWCANLLARKKLRMTIQLPTTAGKNTAIGGRLTAENMSLLPVTKAYVKLRVCNDLTGEEETITLSGTVAARGSGRLDFLLQSSHCGRLYICTEQVRLMDYLGFLPMTARVKASARVTILPELFASEVALSGLSSSDDAGTADRRGDDRTEVFQLRQYVPGDDIRQIHWKLSCKLGELLVKEPSQTVSRSLLIFWDKRTQGTPAVMDALASAVSSVSQAVWDAGGEFTLCWTEKDDLEYREITHTDSLLTAIPALVKDRCSETCPLPDMAGFGRILYFTCDPATLPGADERIFPLVCRETEEDIPGALVFTPENFPQRLERLEIQP